MMLFFYTILFFDPISVNSVSAEDGIKKVTMSETTRCKLWHRVKTHGPGVNRFNGVTLWYDLDYERTSVDDTAKL